MLDDKSIKNSHFKEKMDKDENIDISSNYSF
jgi:hypothetical protein